MCTALPRGKHYPFGALEVQLTERAIIRMRRASLSNPAVAHQFARAVALLGGLPIRRDVRDAMPLGRVAIPLLIVLLTAVKPAHTQEGMLGTEEAARLNTILRALGVLVEGSPEHAQLVFEFGGLNAAVSLRFNCLSVLQPRKRFLFANLLLRSQSALELPCSFSLSNLPVHQPHVSRLPIRAVYRYLGT